MTWAAFENYIQWANPPSTKYQWQTDFGLTEFTVTDKNLITGALSSLYSTSTVAAGIMNAIVSSGKPLRFGQDAVEPGITHAAALGGTPVAVTIGFNLGKIDDFYYINETGELVKEIPGITYIHELIHASRFLGGLSYLDPDQLNLNNANYDQDGPILPVQNAIAQQMGWTDNKQASYHANLFDTDSRFGTSLVTNHEYTDGKAIDNARFGSNAANTLDHSNNTTTNLRDLMFGFAGDDFVYAGQGDDYVYGGDGEDVIEGGTGADVLYGDNFNGVISGSNYDDTIDGGAGDDFIDGGPGANTIDGGADVDILSFKSIATGLTISWIGSTLTQDSGNSSISNIEALIAGSDDDDITVSQLNSIVGGLGGDDVFHFSLSSDPSYADFTTFLQLGDGADEIRLGAMQEFDVLLFDVNSSDRIFSDGVDLSGLTFTYHATPTGTSETWYSTIGDDEYDPIDEQLFIGKLPDTDVVLITYTRYDLSNILEPELLNSLYIYVADFADGDFGFDTHFSVSNGDWQQELYDFANSQDYLLTPSDPTLLGAIANDHLWGVFAAS